MAFNTTFQSLSFCATNISHTIKIFGDSIKIGVIPEKLKLAKFTQFLNLEKINI